jgi:hypothetical protein
VNFDLRLKDKSRWRNPAAFFDKPTIVPGTRPPPMTELSQLIQSQFMSEMV